MKLLHHRGLARPPHLIVNQAASAEEAEETSHRIGLVARRFLQIQLETWDPVPLDATVPRAVRRQEPVFATFPHSPAAAAYRAAAQRLWSAVLPPDPAIEHDQPQRLEA
jgi:flagellar biosynthesis protein FlhG